jgi:hypothetical protein
MPLSRPFRGPRTGISPRGRRPTRDRRARSKPTAPKIAPLLTAQQAGAILRIEPRTLQNWRHRGGGPKYVKVGGSVRYRREDLEEYILQSIRRHTADTPENR